MEPRVLLALTSEAPVFWGSMHTGVFWAELAHPFAVLSAGGFAIDMVAPKGSALIDQVSVPPPVEKSSAEPDHHGNDAESAALYHSPDSPLAGWQDRLLTPDKVDAAAYCGMFFCGGHGTLFDFPGCTALQEIAAAIYASGGVIGAVCHGPSALGGVRDASGASIVAGKRVTGFSPEREQQLGTVSRLHTQGIKLTSEILEEAGAIYIPGPPSTDPNAPHVEVDSRIVTGKNPKSGAPCAEAFLTELRRVAL